MEITVMNRTLFEKDKQPLTDQQQLSDLIVSIKKDQDVRNKIVRRIREINSQLKKTESKGEPNLRGELTKLETELKESNLEEIIKGKTEKIKALQETISGKPVDPTSPSFLSVPKVK